MSEFGVTLQRMMDEKKIAGLDIQRATGIASSTISRITTGDQDFISNQQMTLLTKFVGKDKAGGAELIAAHLKDECIGTGRDLIVISIKDPANLKEEPTPYKTNLRTHNEKAIDFLRQVAIEKPPVMKLLLNLADNEGFQD